LLFGGSQRKCGFNIFGEQFRGAASFHNLDSSFSQKDGEGKRVHFVRSCNPI
jgi:hypothetical protein